MLCPRRDIGSGVAIGTQARVARFAKATHGAGHRCYPRDCEHRALEFQGQRSRASYAPDYRARLSTLAAARAAVLAGVGVARLPRSLVRTDIMEGSMLAWGEYVARPVELWVLHTSRRLVSPKVSAFVALLTESFPTREL